MAISKISRWKSEGAGLDSSHGSHGDHVYGRASLQRRSWSFGRTSSDRCSGGPSRQGRMFFADRSRGDGARFLYGDDHGNCGRTPRVESSRHARRSRKRDDERVSPADRAAGGANPCAFAADLSSARIAGEGGAGVSRPPQPASRHRQADLLSLGRERGMMAGMAAEETDGASF